SFISLPLKISNKSIGVLNLADKRDGTDFSGNDVKLLEAIALYSAVAIERSVYYQSSIDLRKISITDPLTSLLNRRYFEERISEEMERSKRHRQPFSLIILDIDDFKVLNDSYGHLCGDEILKTTTNVIRRCVRVIDIAARYGGEEFAIILPTTDKDDAGIIAERIRSEIAGTVCLIKDAGKKLSITVSLGIASFPDDASTITELINNADRALYSAKNQGKNRVVSFGDL
ncbi:MAG: sensor domain-containing diguanylate cyclase, partial [Nitrospirota bacterium]